MTYVSAFVLNLWRMLVKASRRSSRAQRVQDLVFRLGTRYLAPHLLPHPSIIVVSVFGVMVVVVVVVAWAIIILKIYGDRYRTAICADKITARVTEHKLVFQSKREIETDRWRRKDNKGYRILNGTRFAKLPFNYYSRGLAVLFVDSFFLRV